MLSRFTIRDVAGTPFRIELEKGSPFDLTPECHVVLIQQPVF